MLRMTPLIVFHHCCFNLRTLLHCPKAALIRLNVELLDFAVGDVQVRLAFELQNQLADTADAALGFQKHPSVRQIAHPTGQSETLVGSDVEVAVMRNTHILVGAVEGDEVRGLG